MSTHTSIPDTPARAGGGIPRDEERGRVDGGVVADGVDILCVSHRTMSLDALGPTCAHVLASWTPGIGALCVRPASQSALRGVAGREGVCLATQPEDTGSQGHNV